MRSLFERGRASRRTLVSAGGRGNRLPDDLPIVNDPPVEPLVNTALPAITGTPEVGETLTISTGTWTGDPTGFAAVLSNGAVPVGGGPWTYVVPLGAVGLALTATVTASKVGTPSVPATSAATPTIALRSTLTGGTVDTGPDPDEVSVTASHVGTLYLGFDAAALSASALLAETGGDFHDTITLAAGDNDVLLDYGSLTPGDYVISMLLDPTEAGVLNSAVLTTNYTVTGPASLTVTLGEGRVTSGAPSDPITYAGMAAKVTDDDRTVLIGIHGTTNTPVIASVTVGGVTASLVGVAGTTSKAWLYRADLTAAVGATADVVIDWTTAPTTSAGIVTYIVEGGLGAIAGGDVTTYDAASATSNTITPISVPANGGFLGVFTSGGGSATTAMTLTGSMSNGDADGFDYQAHQVLSSSGGRIAAVGRDVSAGGSVEGTITRSSSATLRAVVAILKVA